MMMPDYHMPPPPLQPRPTPDLRRPPPTIPSALGSDLYPLMALDFDTSRAIEFQMREQSMGRQRSELKVLYSRKDPDYAAFRKTYCRSFRYCDICSEHVNIRRPEMTVVEHTHVSSLKYRAKARVDCWGDYVCPTCQGGVHSVKSGIRYPVLVTTSTLNNWHGKRHINKYPGDPIHIDTIGIPGAEIRQLEHAFSAEYTGQFRPSDVLLVGGLNNVIRGQTPTQIMSQIISFKREVLKNPESSFAVATIPLPPCITRLTRDYYHLTRRDATEDIIELNNRIRKMNQAGGQSMQVHRAPTFHTWGLASTRDKKLMINGDILKTMPAHSLQDWREAQPREQLHLSDETRLRMGRAVVRYFQAIYGIID